jgi:hypothetical protein
VSSPDIQELLPPPLPPAKPFPWRTLMALFVPAAALAAGTGLARVFEAPGHDSVRHWLALSSAAGLVIGGGAGFALRRKAAWAGYGLLAPWVAVGLVLGVLAAVRPAREWLADQREASCRAEGRPVCTLGDFVARCALARSDRARAVSLLGEPRSSSCAGQRCTLKWIYPGPFRPEQLTGPGGLACFVLTDDQGHGVRHWLMAAD